MPSVLYEGLVLLLRESPSLVADLLARAGVDVPPFTTSRVDDADFDQLVPPARHADLALVLLDSSGQPAHALLVEVQLSPDPEKRWTWPFYAAAYHARIRVPVTLVVVALDSSVAAWAAQPVTSLQPPMRFTPVVLGPDLVPWIRDADEAAAAPELALMSALAHGNEPGGVHVAVAAIYAVRHLDDVRAMTYTELVRQALSEASRRALEELMDVKDLKEFLLSEAEKRCRALGRAEGEALGRAEGETLGRRTALLTLLAARRLEVDEAQRGRILGCSDPALLDRWISAAATADSADHLFD